MLRADGTHDVRRRTRLPPTSIHPQSALSFFSTTASVTQGFKKVTPEQKRLGPQVLHFQGFYILHFPSLFTHIYLLRRHEQGGADGGGDNKVLWLYRFQVSEIWELAKKVF